MSAAAVKLFSSLILKKKKKTVTNHLPGSCLLMEKYRLFCMSWIKLGLYGFNSIQNVIQGYPVCFILLLRFSVLLIFDFFVGEQVTFSCTVSSGSSNVTNLSLVEVTKVNSKASHQKVSFPITNLQIPEGSEIHVREFICETEYQQKIVSSKLAKLIIVKLGKFSGHHTQVKNSARLHCNHKQFSFPFLLFCFVFFCQIEHYKTESHLFRCFLFVFCTYFGNI